MITIKSEQEIEKMRQAAEILCKTHLAIANVIREGLTTLQLDKFAHDFMIFKKSRPAQLGYHGFPYSLCTSVNDEICHGFPTSRKLQNGDIVSIDNVVDFNGGLADSCWSYAIGTLSEEAEKLMKVNLKALENALEVARVGNRLGDIGFAIQSYVEKNGFSVVRDFVGHGIGEDMHEDPQVPHYGKKGRGIRLVKNMVITIEPMINAGRWESMLDDNGWTARTIDGSLSCQYEHQIVIGDGHPEVLTDQSKYSLDESDIEFIKNYRF